MSKFVLHLHQLSKESSSYEQVDQIKQFIDSLDEPLFLFYKKITQFSSIQTFWPELLRQCVIYKKPKHFNVMLSLLNKKYNQFEVKTIINYFVRELDYNNETGSYPRTRIFDSFINDNLDIFIKGKHLNLVLSPYENNQKANKNLIFSLISKNIDVMDYFHVSSYKDENLLNFYLKKIGYKQKHYDQIIGLLSECLSKYDLFAVPPSLREIISSNLAEKINPKIIKEFKNSVFYPGYMMFETNLLENNDIANYFLITNKSLKREFYKNFEIKQDSFSIYNCIPGMLVKNVLRLIPNFDQQLLVPFIKQTSQNLRDSKNQSVYDTLISNDDLVWFINFLDKSKLNFTNYFKQIITNNDLVYLSDLKYSLLSIKEGNFFDSNNMTAREFIEKNIREKNLNSIKKMHDFFNRAVIDKNKLPLNQTYTHLNDYEVGGYKIKVPQHPEELVKVGHLLGICVGNGSYAKMVRKRDSRIFFLMNKSSVEYCVEVCNNSVVQAKGYRNISAPEKLLKDLSRIIPLMNDSKLILEKTSAKSKLAKFFNYLKFSFKISIP